MQISLISRWGTLPLGPSGGNILITPHEQPLVHTPRGWSQPSLTEIHPLVVKKKMKVCIFPLGPHPSIFHPSRGPRGTSWVLPWTNYVLHIWRSLHTKEIQSVLLLGLEKINPNPIGLFEGLESIGGGAIMAPPSDLGNARTDRLETWHRYKTSWEE